MIRCHLVPAETRSGPGGDGTENPFTTVGKGAGFNDVYHQPMPDSKQLDALVDYVRSRSSTADGASAPEAITARDPVCGMTIRVTPDTPQVSRAGHSDYFCSEACRTKFVNRSRGAP